MLFCALVAAVLRAAPSPPLPPPHSIHINHEPNEALAVAPGMEIGWALPPSVGKQHSFRLRLTSGLGSPMGEFGCGDPGSVLLDCARSDSVPLEQLVGFPLPASSSFEVEVQLVGAEGDRGAWSAPFRFATALLAQGAAHGGWQGTVPVWAANATQNFVLLRRSFTASRGEHLLHITAHGVPNRKPVAGENATKLLCAYKLWVNGISVSAGPGRPTGDGSTIQEPALLYDTVNVTDLLRFGSKEENVIAVESFYWNEEQERSVFPSTVHVGPQPDNGDLGGVLVLLRATQSGGSEFGLNVAATGDSGWQSFTRGDEALLHPSLPASSGCQAQCPHGDHEKICSKCIIVGGRYQLMHEHFDMAVIPHGWRLPGFVPGSGTGQDGTKKASEWSAPSRRAGGAFPRLATKHARAIALVQHQPVVYPIGERASYVCEGTELPASMTTPAAATSTSYCYIVDMQKEIQGGINITFRHGMAGQQVYVLASETRTPTGEILPNGSDTSFHFDVWSLASLSEQTVVSHEYIEARYWQIVGAPEPPSVSSVAGWKTWYPYQAAGEARDSDVAGTTLIVSSSAALDAVYELCRYTGKIGAMDVNTDSNARQRDNCNVDSHITAMHQAAAAPAASAAYRRRNALFLFEPDAHVHPWTEFKLFSLGAVHAYTLDTGDLYVANHTFEMLLRDYSLTQFIESEDGLVHKAAMAGLPPGMATQAANSAQYYNQVYQDLVDWPNAVDALALSNFPDGATCCLDGYEYGSVSTAINAHVAHAHRRLAQLARWIGRPEAYAATFDAKANAIVAALKARLLTHECTPAAPACFLDGLGPGKTRSGAVSPNINHTSVHATLYVVGCGLLSPKESLTFLPFLKAKTEHYPLFSAMASNFVLQGLYQMATAEVSSSEAADFAFDLLTRSGHRSWMEMLAKNATMAIEHWYGTSLGHHTWSHPWSASPAVS